MGREIVRPCLADAKGAFTSAPTPVNAFISAVGQPLPGCNSADDFGGTWALLGRISADIG